LLICLDLKEWGEATNREIPEDFNVTAFEKELEESVLKLDTDVLAKQDNEYDGEDEQDDLKLL
jgi:hypothetical protein